MTQPMIVRDAPLFAILLIMLRLTLMSLWNGI